MNFENSPRISIVIPLYNAIKYVSSCIDSILSQEGSEEFEIVVVDDGSTDGSYEFVRAQYPSVRLFKKPNEGPGSARNYGVRVARGEVIIFIDSDDVMLPGRLAFQGGFMLENPQFALTAGNQQYENSPDFDPIYEMGISQDRNFHEVPNAFDILFTKSNFIANPACAVRKNVYLEIGGQPTDIRVGEDYDMNLEIARRWPIAVTREYLTWYRQSHTSNLMSSPHIYKGLALLFYKKLKKYREELSSEIFQKGYDRWLTYLNAYLRWLWIEKGRSSVLAEMRFYSDLMPNSLSFKWKLISIFPRGLAFYIRKKFRYLKGDKRN
jgi:glycosyltransferase involved in cell wall biosynthesis